MQNFDIWTVAATAIFSVLGTLTVTFFGHRLGLQKEKSLKREDLDRHARYGAIRSVCILETFVRQCCEIAYDTGVLDSNRKLRPSFPTPTIHFPNDIDWQSLQPDLMYRTLSLPNKLNIAQQRVGFSLQLGEDGKTPVFAIRTDPELPTTEEELRKRATTFAELGLVAFGLARELREYYKINDQIEYDWDLDLLLQVSLKGSSKTYLNENYRLKAADSD